MRYYTDLFGQDVTATQVLVRILCNTYFHNRECLACVRNKLNKNFIVQILNFFGMKFPFKEVDIDIILYKIDANGLVESIVIKYQHPEVTHYFKVGCEGVEKISEKEVEELKTERERKWGWKEWKGWNEL